MLETRKMERFVFRAFSVRQKSHRNCGRFPHKKPVIPVLYGNLPGAFGA